jgi:predicted ATPase
MNFSGKNNWYVITGTSCNGKTTLITLFEKKGFRVVYEAARLIIDEEMKKGRTIEEIRKDEMAFQRKILDRKINLEKELPKDEVVFFDRGIPDSLAYYSLYGEGGDPFLLKAVEECSYKKIFLLDLIPYEKDYARTESDEQRKQIQDLLFKGYNDLPMPVVFVPPVSPEERMDFILDQLT